MSDRWSRLGWTVRLALIPMLTVVAIAAAFIASPLPPGLLDYQKVTSVKLLDREGRLLREVRTKEGLGTPLAAAEIPPLARDAFLAAEDHRYFAHPGVSFTALVRAAWQDLKAHKVVAGGSTLTMQLSRLLMPHPRTLSGKVTEILWALRLEAHTSKPELLAQYLNRVPLGNNAVGLEAASELYFGVTAEHLSLDQAAALASLPRGPTNYDPYRHLERLTKRQSWVLGRMAQLQLVSAADAEAARKTALDLSAFSSNFRAPHFTHFVGSHLPEWGMGGAAVVQTTLDLELQRKVEDAVSEELARLKERRVSSAAALVIDNATGEVLAYVGSRNFFDEDIFGQNDGVQMKRQPGSALKPFAYAEAFAHDITPATVLADTMARFGAEKGAYRPQNYDRRTHGPVRAREALANSYNVPAVRLAEKLGPARLLGVLHAAGFESLQQSPEHYGLGLVLGDGEVSLWEGARAYSGLSRGGLVKPLTAVRHAWRADGSEIRATPELQPRRFADPKAVALVTDILSDNAARARAFGLQNALRLDFPAAAKTGTSKGYSDNWTFGFTRERTVAVWAGNFDGTPMVQVSGITGAGPVFKRSMRAAMRDLTPAPLVDERGLEYASICPLSGLRAGPHCPSAMDELFVAGTAPHEHCDAHDAIAAGLEPSLKKRCEALNPGGRVTDFGPGYYAWARSHGLDDEPWMAAACREGTTREVAEGFDFPGNGDEYQVIDDLPLEDQAIPVRVRAKGDGLQLRVDGELKPLPPPYSTRLPAVKGHHTLALVRGGSEIAHIAFDVR
ncbi:MAG: penicillin-binding protein 1C [Myxococcaceae bacterium]